MSYMGGEAHVHRRGQAEPCGRHRPECERFVCFRRPDQTIMVRHEPIGHGCLEAGALDPRTHYSTLTPAAWKTLAIIVEEEYVPYDELDGKELDDEEDDFIREEDEDDLGRASSMTGPELASTRLRSIGSAASSGSPMTAAPLPRRSRGASVDSSGEDITTPVSRVSVAALGMPRCPAEEGPVAVFYAARTADDAAPAKASSPQFTLPLGLGAKTKACPSAR